MDIDFSVPKTKGTNQTFFSDVQKQTYGIWGQQCKRNGQLALL